MIKKLFLTVSIIVIFTLTFTTAKNPPTKIDFYMESLCPYCVKFTINKVKVLLATKGHEELADLNIIPYGNAKETLDSATGKYNYTCQHGEKECRGNLIESCAIKTFDKPSANNFIVCLEENYTGDFDETAENCANEIQSDDLMHCLNTNVGNLAQHEFADQTINLSPPHKYVPWIVVNGLPNEKINSSADIVEYLCSIRTDRAEIAICNTHILFTENKLEFLENKNTAREW